MFWLCLYVFMLFCIGSWLFRVTELELGWSDSDAELYLAQFCGQRRRMKAIVHTHTMLANKKTKRVIDKGENMTISMWFK